MDYVAGMVTRKEEREARERAAQSQAAESDDGEAARNERVLHTRVPAVLEKELKRMATALRVPVSNVVRTILSDAVDTIDSVGAAAEGELRGVRARLRKRLAPGGVQAADGASDSPDVDEARGRATPPLAGIVGYQPLLLARQEGCSLCGRPMRAGEQAYLGIRESLGGARVLLDPGCLPTSVAGDGNDHDTGNHTGKDRETTDEDQS